MKKTRNKGLIRKSEHSIEEVYAAVSSTMFNKRKTRIMFQGDEIKTTSQRYQLFFTKGMRCVNCGIEGRFFAKEKTLNDQRYHLNLYAVNAIGQEVLMTKDHIIPKSKGGKNKLENYQTMCMVCNAKKGNKCDEPV